jgi:hypothetical protein
MATSKHAVILIPGMDSREKGAAQRRLVQGMVNCTERMQVTESGQISLPGEKGMSVAVGHPDGRSAEIHVFEAFWRDLTHQDAPKQALARVRDGGALLVYWFFSGVWRALTRSSWYMTTGLLLSSLLLMAWYYSVLAVGLAAIGTDPDLVRQYGGQPVLGGLIAFVGDVGKRMGSWQAWVLVSVLLGFVPVEPMVEISAFTKRYLRNEAGADGVGCRDKIRHRMKGILDEAIGSGAYQSVTVLAHSFGTLLAVDLLAEYSPRGQTALRLVTMGSPLELLGYRSAWLRAEISRCLENAAITAWLDFFSKDDWMCSKVPGHGAGAGQESRPQIRESSLLAKLSGESHKAYYQSQEIMETLAAVP